MSIIKQKSVSSERHAKNLRDYINDKDALLRDGQHISIGKNWYREMDETREEYGHNKASRIGAKNTIMYHQVIAFLPDEADFYGGKMTPEKCMEYAREYIQTRYPNQQIALALHLEHCKEDGTSRYAVHMAINRTNLETGRRLDEGRSEVAKRSRAKSIRALDDKWGLQQVEKDKRNSKIHNQQPRGAEKEIALRGGDSYKSNLRELVRYARDKAASMNEFKNFLAEWGVTTKIKNGKVYATDEDNSKYTFSAPKLDGALNLGGLQKTFENNDHQKKVEALAGELQNEEKQVKQYVENKDNYKTLIAEKYQEFHQTALAAKGTDFDKFPQLKLPRPPGLLIKDPEVQASILSYMRKADTLRHKLSDNAPVDKQGSRKTSAGGQQPETGRTLGGNLQQDRPGHKTPGER